MEEDNSYVGEDEGEDSLGGEEKIQLTVFKMFFIKKKKFRAGMVKS